MSRRIPLDSADLDVTERLGTATVRLASWDEPTELFETLVDDHIVRWQFVYPEGPPAVARMEDIQEPGVRIGVHPQSRRLEFVDLDLNVISDRLQGVERITTALDYTVNHEPSNAIRRLTSRVALLAIRTHSKELATAG